MTVTDTLARIVFRRLRRPRRSLPDDWARLLADHLADWPMMSAQEQEWIVDASAELLATRSWEAAQGATLTDSMCTVIASQIALSCLGYRDAEGLDPVRRVETIIVHPGTITFDGVHYEGDGMYSEGRRTLSGEAHHGHGPLLLSWLAVRHETRRRNGTRNVVIHEVAHKFDMLDGEIDGTPPMADDARLQRFHEVSRRVFRVLRLDGDEVLDDYAATNMGEFFAVAAELFFAAPGRMRDVHPELYDCYRDIFRQDPAARRGLTG